MAKSGLRRRHIWRAGFFLVALWVVGFCLLVPTSVGLLMFIPPIEADEVLLGRLAMGIGAVLASAITIYAARVILDKE